MQIQAFNTCHEELSNSITLKLKLRLMHVETFSRGRRGKKNKRKVLKIHKNKRKIAENWHKTIFNLGLKASITSLVQIVVEDIRVRQKLPNQVVHLWETQICTFFLILNSCTFCLHSEPSFSNQVKYHKICSQKLVSQKWKIIQDFCSDWCYLKNIGSHICWNWENIMNTLKMVVLMLFLASNFFLISLGIRR